jgi:hypothetical protein
VEYSGNWDSIFYAGYNPRMPELIPKPAHWFTKSRSPVPVGYFLDITQRIFWDTYVRK